MKGRATLDGEVEFRALVEAVPGLFVVVAADLTIVVASDGYLRVMKADRAAVVGRDLFEAFPGVARALGAAGGAALRASLDRVLASRAAETLPIQRVGDGERRWRLTNAPVLARDGQVSHVVHSVEDVTATAELEESVAALTDARDRAEHASELKSRFLGMVSHELRTPLTALSLQVERMQRHGESLDARNGEALQRIAFSAGRLREMIETLLEYARVEGGRVTMNLAPFDLRPAVERIVDNHRFHAEQKGLAISGSVGAAPATLTSDERLVELVVSNLVDNAIKFTSTGGVDVGLTQGADGWFRVAVHDTGAGIPAQQQAAIFEPFEQLGPSSYDHPPGIGLGLALVRDIAGVLGGRIELVSAPGGGSTFTLLLPSSSPAYNAA